jgi:cytochrome c553
VKPGGLLAIASLVLACSAAQADEPEMLARAQRIVSGNCFLCHGMQGEASSELSPRLAAQNQAYLVKQLANFKSGERRSSAMRPMVANLSADDMQALGLYFSRQRSEPHPGGDPELASRGKRIYEAGGKAPQVRPCVECHGTRAHGSDALPRLAGQIPAYVATQLRLFASGERTNDRQVVHPIAAAMTAEEIAAVAAYLSTLD